MADVKLVDKLLLKMLVPAGSLNMENFQELAGKAFIEEVPIGKTIFKPGDTDRKTIYLLAGQLVLTDATGKSIVISEGSDTAKQPIANAQPRLVTAKARADCKITRLDSDLLDILLTWDQLSGIEVSEIQATGGHDNDTDWMTRILQSKAFLQIPPANIQNMFMRMEEVPKQAGEAVIRQGEDGDFYYIVKEGRAKVTRASKTGSELTLATLRDGDAFGEEALISEAKRNATVIMETDGFLMRLSKADFNALLKEPLINWLEPSGAQQKITEGGKWLDVRLESERANSGVPDSLNIPLFMLRLKIDTLNPNVPYVICCDTGRRSSAAAFLLNERGFDTYVLRGGVGARIV